MARIYQKKSKFKQDHQREDLEHEHAVPEHQGLSHPAVPVAYSNNQTVAPSTQSTTVQKKESEKKQGQVDSPYQYHVPRQFAAVPPVQRITKSEGKTESTKQLLSRGRSKNDVAHGDRQDLDSSHFTNKQGSSDVDTSKMVVQRKGTFENEDEIFKFQRVWSKKYFDLALSFKLLNAQKIKLGEGEDSGGYKRSTKGSGGGRAASTNKVEFGTTDDFGRCIGGLNLDDVGFRMGSEFNESVQRIYATGFLTFSHDSYKSINGKATIDIGLVGLDFERGITLPSAEIKVKFDVFTAKLLGVDQTVSIEGSGVANFNKGALRTYVLSALKEYLLKKAKDYAIEKGKSAALRSGGKFLLKNLGPLIKAFSIGYEIGTFINETFGLSDKISDYLIEDDMAMGYTSGDMLEKYSYENIITMEEKIAYIEALGGGKTFEDEESRIVKIFEYSSLPDRITLYNNSDIFRIVRNKIDGSDFDKLQRLMAEANGKVAVKFTDSIAQQMEYKFKARAYNQELDGNPFSAATILEKTSEDLSSLDKIVSNLSADEKGKLKIDVDLVRLEIMEVSRRAEKISKNEYTISPYVRMLMVDMKKLDEVGGILLMNKPTLKPIIEKKLVEYAKLSLNHGEDFLNTPQGQELEVELIQLIEAQIEQFENIIERYDRGELNISYLSAP